jgi:hypothetical protein
VAKWLWWSFCQYLKQCRQISVFIAMTICWRCLMNSFASSSVPLLGHGLEVLVHQDVDMRCFDRETSVEGRAPSHGHSSSNGGRDKVEVGRICPPTHCEELQNG